MYSRSLKPERREFIKEEARKAAELAVAKAFQQTTIRMNDFASISDSDASGSFDLSRSERNHSLKSHEIAMHRGSQLGSFERNESSQKGLRVPRQRLFSDSNDDTGTRSTTIASLFSKTSMTGSRKRKNTMASETHGQPSELWMCGVCAQGFTSFEAAELHENYHIKEIVMDLGWTVDNNFSNFVDDLEDLKIPERRQEQQPPPPPPKRQISFHTESPLRTKPRPDILRMSSPAAPSKRVNVQPYTPTLQRKKSKNPRRHSIDSLYAIEENEEFKLTTSLPDPKDIVRHDARNDETIPLLLSDEALVDVCSKAECLILSAAEMEAEKELEWLAKDKAYYDLLSKRALQRNRDRTNTYRFRREGTSALATIQNKVADAYQLMKEGKGNGKSTTLDYYNRKMKGNSEERLIIDHTRRTLYINVMVKNSIRVVRHELERLAKKRWEDSQLAGKEETDIQRNQFQKFRAVAQDNLVKLAGYALASDFTPRRIAVQLSNDFYKLLTPRLNRRGVVIETEIDYRVGAYFILAVNIKHVYWRRLVKTANRDAAERKSKWSRDNEVDNSKNDSKKAGVVLSYLQDILQLMRVDRIEVLAHFLAWMYYFHWVVYTPICFILYNLFPKTFRTYFISSVADEIFYYVEQKGMQMDIGIRDTSTQAAFMLSALREMRAGEQKKKHQDGEAASQTVTIGPLLGPAIKADKSAAPPRPENFEVPANLDFVGLELDIPVGFKRLRWALLSSQSSFMTEAVFRTEAKYENIESGNWSKFDEAIGLAALPDSTTETDLIGAEKEASYLMPKSAFVKANMAYEVAYIEAYNDYCFCLKKKARTPEVPYGSSFVAWTKFVVINTGSNSCKIICSVEAEFPNGPPMVSRQIQSGMKSGVGELFVKIGETITKYADEYP